MVKDNSNSSEKVLVAIDVAKMKHDVLYKLPGKKPKKAKIRNRKQDFDDLIEKIVISDIHTIAAIEATGDYHRALATYLKNQGVEVVLVSSVALSRTREALHNSWDKHDVKDAQVILHMLENNMIQYFHDPLFEGNHDFQEISKTYHQVSLRKTKLGHSILNHCLPLYFPEAEKYYNSSRAEWFARMLYKFPCPSAILKYSEKEFIEKAWLVAGRKVAKETFLADVYEQAKNSVALPVSEECDAIKMFRMVLEDYLQICQRRAEIEKFAKDKLQNHPDFELYTSVPGVGAIVALTIIAEAGDIRRFKHHRQFLKYCGLDLATHQSGQFRGKSKLSKRGNARLRMILWMASTIAIRQQENTFRRKFERYIRIDPNNPDLKRKAYTATAAKMARVIHGLIKTNSKYRPYFEDQRTA